MKRPSLAWVESWPFIASALALALVALLHRSGALS